MKNIESTVINQYQNSPIIIDIIGSVNDAIDITSDEDLIYENLFDIQSAKGVGLDRLGSVVAISRQVRNFEPPKFFGFIEAGDAYPFASKALDNDVFSKNFPFCNSNGDNCFGFSEAGNSFYGFSKKSEDTLYTGVLSPFYTDQSLTYQIDFLDDESYRLLILVKSLSNFSELNVFSINKLLKTLFENRGRCYCTDIGDMRITLTFDFLLTSKEMSILLYNNIFFRPAGVSCEIFSASSEVFGFSEDSQPFSQAPFIHINAIHGVV